MRENVDQNNSEYGHFLRNDGCADEEFKESKRKLLNSGSPKSTKCRSYVVIRQKKKHEFMKQE